jgi:hypothetical protein
LSKGDPDRANECGETIRSFSLVEGIQRCQQPISQTPGELQLNPLAAAAPIAQIGWAHTAQALGFAEDGIETCSLQGAQQLPLQMRVSSADEDGFPLAATSVDGNGKERRLRDFPPDRFVEPDAGEVQVSVARLFHPLESVKRVLATGNGIGNLRRAGLDPAPVGRQNGNARRGLPQPYPIVPPGILVSPELCKAVVEAHHDSFTIH